MLKPPRMRQFFSALWGRFEFFLANLPSLIGPYQRYRDLFYGSDPRQRLDVYVPTRRLSDRCPVIVFWHGGHWRRGDKSDYRFVGAALAKAGNLAVIANYRLYPQVRLAGFMSDAALAVQWSSEHAREFGADPARLYVMGHSAGAHMAALLTLDPHYLAALEGRSPRIAGVIGLSGPYDFLPLEEDTKDVLGPPDRYADSQPINFVRDDAPPMLLVHGAKDVVVRPRNSLNLAAALRALNIPINLKVYEQAGHADTVAALTSFLRHRAPTLVDVVEFLDAQERAAQVRPSPV